ncbi:hypothetical protein OAF63_04335 [Saprospiraceae bacterium]|jgi:predicted flap endonuclease-1-like 5' DNA nuclease|nr:hypothetical protein [Saprospiraceae bacterium]
MQTGIFPHTSPPPKDDLKLILGIGPKVENLLNDAEIMTFASLGASKGSLLRAILSEGGARYRSINPAKWSEQAVLAANGKMEELKDYKVALKTSN